MAKIRNKKPMQEKIPTQRVPFTLRGSECSLLLNIKHKMEVEANKPLTISEILREALYELARVKGVAISN